VGRGLKIEKHPVFGISNSGELRTAHFDRLKRKQSTSMKDMAQEIRAKSAKGI